ncbi:hypothetical protein [Microbacterium sp. NPDC076895]|uniref:hypothetical protein n=1 Tax=Microbacterium sp. NPDC076895 TaxID=3154957 RepID=UPI00342B1887
MQPKNPLSSLLDGVIVLLAAAILASITVWIIQQIWVWLVGIAAAAVLVTAAVIVVRILLRRRGL